MLDDLRDSATESYLDDDETSLEYYDPDEYGDDSESSSREMIILGMNAPQRFVIALILFLMTCVLGAFCLVLSGKMSLDFLL